MSEAQTGSRDPAYVKMGDAYFRRLLVPFVITLLIFAAALAIIVVPPGTGAGAGAGAGATTVSWSNFASSLGAKAFGSSS